MDLNLLNKEHFHFICTNYSSNRDGIGHYTSKIVNELKKNDLYKISTYSRVTHNLSKRELVLSFRMTLELIKLSKILKKSNNNDYVILEYPFVEYNPLFLVILFKIRLFKTKSTKIVVSLHEYKRTKLLRKLFIKLLIPMADIVFYTKDEDIMSFLKKKKEFVKRAIPANIQPLQISNQEPSKELNLCFFGIINFETKNIENMIKAWDLYCDNNDNNNLSFHFITSSYNTNIKEKKNIKYHYNLNDRDVSNLISKMHFMMLPLKPKISINNGSLSVSCIHKCIPVGDFDENYFNQDFGISMNDYSLEEFVKVYKLISQINYLERKEKAEIAFNYGKTKSILNTVKVYSNLGN